MGLSPAAKRIVTFLRATPTSKVSYDVEWFSVASRETKKSSTMKVERAGKLTFTSPFPLPGPSVLYLKRAGR